MTEDRIDSGARPWLALAAANGFMGVAAGAFGAHAATDPAVKEWLRTGAQYQLVHAVAALAVLALFRRTTWPARLFGLGALVFGGSLYLMALTGVRGLGAVTPIGGVLFLAGWALLIWGSVAPRRPPQA
jgi:uncharacterized membrane protein YgdD (TMEM256/DUF423 family)